MLNVGLFVKLKELQPFFLTLCGLGKTTEGSGVVAPKEKEMFGKKYLKP